MTLFAFRRRHQVQIATGILPEVGSIIWFVWGHEIVKAKVQNIHTPSAVWIIETTDPMLFGGSQIAHNINFKNQEWVYD